MNLGGEADQVRELAHRLEIAERRETFETEGIEVVAGEQSEVVVGADDDAGAAVMQQVALAHGLDHQRIGGRIGLSPRTGSGEEAEHGRGVDIDHVRADDRILSA